VAVYSLYHYFFIGIVEATEGVRRMLAVYHSPNALALFLGRALPMAIALTLFLRGEGVERVLRLLCGLAVVLIGASVFLTYSRGAWLGLAASIFFIAAVKGRRIFVAAVGAIAALAAVVIPFVNAGRLISSGTNFLRLSLWQSAVNMIRDHPVFGVGLDNFLYYYRDRGYMLPDAWPDPEMSHPHNLVLDYWTRLGLLGLASLLALQASFWRAAWGTYRRLGNGPTQIVVLALMASMVDFLVHGLVDNSYFLIDLAMVFWLTLGAVEIIAREGK
jgi:O-antigen ligase